MTPAHSLIRLGREDNVLVSLRPLSAGTRFDDVTLATDVPAGHKVAARFIRSGEPILKDGAVIGLAAADKAPGEHLGSRDIDLPIIQERRPEVTVPIPAATLLPTEQRATFQGIVRPNGEVATRNFIGVFVVGNCGATAARQTTDFFDEERLAAYPNVDGVVPFVHEIGCGMEMTGEPMDLLRRTISGFIRHPNIAAAVVVALGCERNNLKSFLEQEKLEVGDKLRTVTLQEVGGIKAAVEVAKGFVFEMLPVANQVRREAVPVSHLRVGLQSGGPDGLSGLSADPALGAAVDLLVAHGGTAILSETPELAAIEAETLARAATPAVARGLKERIEWWRGYNAGKDTQLHGRVSRANEAAGLANIIEKSLASAKKAGTSPIRGAYRYAERVAEHGLVFMDAPTYEPVSVTGQIAAGATLIALTTGLGSSFGSLPTPTMKLASTSAVFARMEDDMDVDCGPVIEGTTSVADMGRAIFEQMLRHASGEKTKSEAEGMGENEFVPWPIGVLA